MKSMGLKGFTMRRRWVDPNPHLGDEVLAAGEGTVYFVGKVAGKPVVSISHADGVRTTYQQAGLASQ